MYTIGIDVGGTNLVAGVVDGDGKLLAKAKRPTAPDRGADAVLDDMAAVAEDAAVKAGVKKSDIAWVGIGCPGSHSKKTGMLLFANNIPFLNTPMVAAMQKTWDCPVYLENDANAAALGEMLFGAAKGMKDFISITLGTGLGSGIVSNGEMVYGADGFAGEIGHTIVDPNGRECACGRLGCLETYCSATGLCRTVVELICNTAVPSDLRGVSYKELSAAKIYEAAIGGDALALSAFETCGETLGRKLSDSVAHLSPEAIFICGGMAAAGELIMAPTRRALEKYVLPIYRGKVKILPSGLPEGNVAVLGASALAWSVFDKAGK